MKKWLALLGLPFVFLLAGCDDSNGWDAYPIGDQPDTCYQITEWQSNGHETKTWAKGVYCPVDIEKETR